MTQISVNDLFRIMGKLYVEKEILAAQLAERDSEHANGHPAQQESVNAGE